MLEILIVEDDLDISNLLRDLLEQNGYQVQRAFSGTEAILVLEKSPVDLVLLDLMLPGKPGQDVLDTLRQRSSTPVIALTAVGDRDSKIATLKAGADDYVTKPFDNDELLARIEARLRHNQPDQLPTETGKIRCMDLEIDPLTYEVQAGGAAVALSRHEFEILKLLMEHPKRVFTKNAIYEAVWGEEFLGDDNTIAVHISRIRARLAKANPQAEYIQTVWGIGFKMQS